MDVIRSYLKELRSQAMLTQAEIARKLNISESYYSLVEAGERQRNMSLSLMERLADVFEVSVGYIVACELKFKKCNSDEASGEIPHHEDISETFQKE